MAVLDHPRHLLDAWSVCEALRRFGFHPDSMSVRFGPLLGVGDDVLQVVLSADDTEFITAAATAEGMSPEEALSGWAELWQDVVKATEDELSIVMSRCVAGDYVRVVRLASQIVARGITLPYISAEAASPLVLIVPHAPVLSKGGEA